jgi:hypothetical protein
MLVIGPGCCSTPEKGIHGRVRLRSSARLGNRGNSYQ